jgi:hypothetical protein
MGGRLGVSRGSGSEAMKGPQTGRRLCQSRAHCGLHDPVESDLVRQLVTFDHARREERKDRRSAGFLRYGLGKVAHGVHYLWLRAK